MIGSKHFQQSKEWRRAKEIIGNKTFLVGQYFVQKTKLPILNYYVGYMPRVDIRKIDFDNLIKLGKEQRCISIQIDPNNLLTNDVSQVTSKFNSAEPVALQYNVILDLTKTEEELLSSFKPKHRYNIKVAQRQGLNFSIENTNESFILFLDLYEQTKKRQKYNGRSREYLKAVWDSFSGMSYIAKVSKDDEVLAAWFLICYESCVYYVYGGSLDKNQNMMPSFLMVWEIIKWARTHNYKSFDMMGIKDPTIDKNRETGFTRFKLGWSSNKYIKYANSFEIVINPYFYKLYKIAQIAKRLKNKLLQILH